MRCSKYCLLYLCLPLFLVPAGQAKAQRGSLIEDLFRTIAEAQLEREQRKRLEAEQEVRQQPPVPDQPLQQVPVPRGGLIAPAVDSGRGAPITVRSREAAEFAQDLVSFHGTLAPLIQEMRSGAASSPAIRGLLPKAYEVAADTRTVLELCNGISALDPMRDPYAGLDARWRNLSFELRSLDGLSSQCTAGIRDCDDLISRMSRQLRIEPQFDRHDLHDWMVVAATYMQALIDDLQVANLPRREAERLTHDCRLLRQRLLAEADHVDDTTYEDVITRFNDFARQWSAFSEQVYACNDPHLDLRLERIRECVDQTYALLWLPPPYNARTLTASAERLQKTCAAVLDQLTLRSMVAMSTQQRLQILDTSHRMFESSQAFARATEQNAPRENLRRRFAEIDSDWAYLSPLFYNMPGLNQATLASLDHECDHLRRALGLRSAAGPSIMHEELIQVAASIEGASEYFEADLARYQRYLQPEAYRRSILNACREFHRHARQLHAHLDRRADLAVLQREARHMLDGWEQLTQDLSHLEGHGLSSRRAQQLRRAHQELVPHVARIAAALAER